MAGRKKRRRSDRRTGGRRRKGTHLAHPLPLRAEEPFAETHAAVEGLEPVTIVGIGASAGGLEAFSQLLQALPENPGLALVLVQHLAPQHESALPALLGGKTRLPVVQVTDGMRVQTNSVYVIPPNVHMSIVDGTLQLVPRPNDSTQYTPVDFFLRSLADVAEHHAIGVVLSGTASDGALGVRDIKAVGGITIAQDPETAKYDGMPRAAIATGMVDLVLRPSDIAGELVKITRHPHLRHPWPRKAGDDLLVADDHLERVFSLLRSASGVDFRHYKAPTIRRRLQRRMALHKLSGIEQYLGYLQEHPGEVHQLYQDLLINVTRFFREPGSFEVLADSVLPRIMEHRSPDDPVRVWVPGCSTGEEVYSIAIVLLEFLGGKKMTIPIQVFGTDVSDVAIEHARSGIYPASIAADVSAERLRRFFNKIDGSYRSHKAVRDLCLFARQDVTRDPPFSRLDLILCRNVLIYMSAVLQRRLINVFHYALKRTGFLMLGEAETIGGHADLFELLDKKYKLYSKRAAATSQALGFAVDYSSMRIANPRGRPEAPAEAGVVQGEVNRFILDAYGPPGVVVDQNQQIIQFRGQTGPFLEPSPGDASLNLLRMAREGLVYSLRKALGEARQKHAAVHKNGLRVRADGGWRTITLHVVPLTGPAKDHTLVLFEDAPASVGRTSAPARGRARREAPASRGRARAGGSRVTDLQQELAASREYLQSIIQELEAANAELQSANEEILSSNEELQSTNEELDTAKEELQSTNEELNTVNEELHARNDELSRVNSDLVNLLGSVQIAIVIVAADLRIRRFTPMAEKVLNLIPSDVGRFIGHIKPSFECPDLEQLIHQAVENVAVSEREVHDGQGRWFSLRIRPYKNLENRIDGAVLSLFDISSAKQHETELHDARDFSRAVIDAVRQPLVVLDPELRIRMVNHAFCQMFRTTPDDVERRFVYDLWNGQPSVAHLRGLLEEVVVHKKRNLDDFEAAIDLPENGRRMLHLSARRFEARGEAPGLVLLAMEDVTPDGEADAP
jgi:two-component system, chemotaxis family, CheB/CheR fusion protein